MDRQGRCVDPWGGEGVVPAARVGRPTVAELPRIGERCDPALDSGRVLGSEGGVPLLGGQRGGDRWEGRHDEGDRPGGDVRAGGIDDPGGHIVGSGQCRSAGDLAEVRPGTAKGETEPAVGVDRVSALSGGLEIDGPAEIELGGSGRSEVGRQGDLERPGVVGVGGGRAPDPPEQEDDASSRVRVPGRFGPPSGGRGHSDDELRPAPVRVGPVVREEGGELEPPEHQDEPVDGIVDHDQGLSLDRSGGREVGPVGPETALVGPGIMEVTAGIVRSSEQEDVPIGRVPRDPPRLPGRRRERNAGRDVRPGSPDERPRIVEEVIGLVLASEHQDIPVDGVVGHHGVLAGRGCDRGVDRGPRPTLPFPGVVEVHAGTAPEQDHVAVGRVVGDLRLVTARRHGGQGGGQVGPAAVREGPRIVDRAGSGGAPEEEDIPVGRVVHESFPFPGARGVVEPRGEIVPGGRCDDPRGGRGERSERGSRLRDRSRDRAGPRGGDRDVAHRKESCGEEHQ